MIDCLWCGVTQSQPMFRFQACLPRHQHQHLRPEGPDSDKRRGFVVWLPYPLQTEAGLPGSVVFCIGIQKPSIYSELNPPKLNKHLIIILCYILYNCRCGRGPGRLLATTPGTVWPWPGLDTPELTPIWCLEAGSARSEWSTEIRFRATIMRTSICAAAAIIDTALIKDYALIEIWTLSEYNK